MAQSLPPILLERGACCPAHKHGIPVNSDGKWRAATCSPAAFFNLLPGDPRSSQGRGPRRGRCDTPGLPGSGEGARRRHGGAPGPAPGPAPVSAPGLCGGVQPDRRWRGGCGGPGGQRRGPAGEHWASGGDCRAGWGGPGQRGHSCTLPFRGASPGSAGPALPSAPLAASLSAPAAPVIPPPRLAPLSGGSGCMAGVQEAPGFVQIFVVLPGVVLSEQGLITARVWRSLGCHMQAVGRCRSVFSALLNCVASRGETGRAPDLLVTLVAQSLGYENRIRANPLCLSLSNEPHRFTADVLSSAKPAHGKISILGNLHPLSCPLWYHFRDGAVLHSLPSALWLSEPCKCSSDNIWQEQDAPLRSEQVPLGFTAMTLLSVDIFSRASVGFWSVYQNILHVCCDVACN